MEASHLFCAKQFLFVTEEQVTNLVTSSDISIKTRAFDFISESLSSERPFFFHAQFNLQTYTQIHTPTVVQRGKGWGGVGGDGWSPSPEFLIRCGISKLFYF